MSSCEVRKDAPPILVLVGDHDMAGRLEEAKLFGVVMKDVAHMLNMEKPMELNSLMLDFLKN